MACDKEKVRERLIRTSSRKCQRIARRIVLGLMNSRLKWRIIGKRPSIAGI